MSEAAPEAARGAHLAGLRDAARAAVQRHAVALARARHPPAPRQHRLQGLLDGPAIDFFFLETKKGEKIKWRGNITNPNEIEKIFNVLF